ncbi:MAG: ribonuclease J [Maricaulaceae bacterium]
MSDKDTDAFVFLPLGGSGEIGMNLNLYGFGPAHKRQWIIVDLGVTFADETTPGVDIILPDTGFIEERAEDLLAIVLTHAPEDHMGAVARLWPRLKAPIYATPFTAWLVRDRLAELDLLDEVPVHEIGLNSQLTLGPFDLQLITLTHSIPEPNGLAIRTPTGLVLHTGDWKIDPDPQIGATTDVAALTALGEAGIDAIVCDSTNVFSQGEAGSEGSVRAELIAQVAKCEGKVALAAFASNVARLESAIVAAQANDRHVCLVGRSMHRMTAAAKAVGLLSGAEPFVDEEEAGYLPPNKVLYLCTGSQGEPRAALSRIAWGAHRHVTLGEGDTVLFSSRVIPGNEVAIYALQNQLAERGVEIVTDRMAPIHVSGHPCRNDLRAMYQWARPKAAIPVHGERRHLLEHVKFARELQVASAYAPHNGDMIAINGEGVSCIDQVPAGRLILDGDTITPLGSEALRARKRMAYNGHVVVAFAIDAKGKLISDFDIRVSGLPSDDAEQMEGWLDDLADVAETALSKLDRRARADEAACEEAVVRALKRRVNATWRKRAHIEAVALRV